jgi:hypothetical protein
MYSYSNIKSEPIGTGLGVNAPCAASKSSKQQSPASRRLPPTLLDFVGRVRGAQGAVPGRPRDLDSGRETRGELKPRASAVAPESRPRLLAFFAGNPIGPRMKRKTISHSDGCLQGVGEKAKKGEIWANAAFKHLYIHYIIQLKLIKPWICIH